MVNIDFLLEQGILTAAKQGSLKILGDGELNVPLHVQAVAFTSQAKAKIEAAGGSCEVIPRTQATIKPESVEETSDGR